jgi:hypothetical protein
MQNIKILKLVGEEVGEEGEEGTVAGTTLSHLEKSNIEFSAFLDQM